MTLASILRQFKWSVGLTICLVILESALFLLFPLFIGYAINDLLEASHKGIIQLGILGISGLVIGAARRLYDTRTYAKVYQKITVDTMEKDEASDTSKLSAHLGMLRELVEFFETSFPQIFGSIIGFVGTIIIIYAFSIHIFWACIILVLFIIIVFGLTSKKTILYNTNYNNTLEEQVGIVEKRNPEKVRIHIRQLMKWNIKLSDLETMNFSLLWLAIIGLLIYAIVDTVHASEVKYGTVFSIVMYVYQFAEECISLPLFYQQWLRLREISTRLNSKEAESIIKI